MRYQAYAAILSLVMLLARPILAAIPWIRIPLFARSKLERMGQRLRFVLGDRSLTMSSRFVLDASLRLFTLR